MEGNWWVIGGWKKQCGSNCTRGEARCEGDGALTVGALPGGALPGERAWRRTKQALHSLEAWQKEARQRWHRELKVGKVGKGGKLRKCVLSHPLAARLGVGALVRVGAPLPSCRTPCALETRTEVKTECTHTRTKRVSCERE